MAALRPVFRRSLDPRYDPDWSPYDGLDGVVLNGVEVGTQHRERVRRQAEAVRKRERAELWLTANDDG